ncbi:hypothetical protein PHLGIDRAFT_427478 [Phlebiopsis gigantea 11061_1 CR5-6]|uniref:Secreted protein n=1 Tax=Phlebiopsis gigantea (strain 11061_1 CR5-6) TaxID=745531 RepID=A0A0C3NQ12_PHLG1|nr:hypothetical protein PHLGIDRAFT_427478 [Phlebiopsis gigantea 11061_1 CR5-6]
MFTVSVFLSLVVGVDCFRRSSKAATRLTSVSAIRTGGFDRVSQGLDLDEGNITDVLPLVPAKLTSHPDARPTCARMGATRYARPRSLTGHPEGARNSPYILISGRPLQNHSTQVVPENFPI